MLTQFSLLAGLHWLDQQGELVIQQRLADCANTDRMMTSEVLQALEKKTLIERLDNPKDDRTRKIRLTEMGEIVLRQANTRIEQVDSDFFALIQSDALYFNQNMQQLATKNILESLS